MREFEVKRVDLWDGGERHNFGFYIDATVPDNAIEKANRYCLIHHQVLVIFDTLDERKENSNRDLKRRAWAKLTPLEREALGILKEP